MRIACMLLLLASFAVAQDVVLDMKVYVGSYDATEAGSVIISLPEGKLTPTSGPSVAEEIQRTFHLKTLDLVAAPRMVTSIGLPAVTATAADKQSDGYPIQMIKTSFKPISANKETAHLSLQFSVNGGDDSGAEMMVRPNQPFTLSSRLDGHLVFLICTLHFMEQEGETPPRVVKKEAPVYPEELKKEGVQGVVVLKLHIDVKGKVLKCEKAKADDDRFVAPACEAALRWEFEPARKDGKPIPYDYFITLAFRLQ